MDNNDKYFEIRVVGMHEASSMSGWELIQIREASTVMHLVSNEPHPRLREDPYHHDKTIMCTREEIGTELKFVFGRRKDDYTKSLQERAQAATENLQKVSTELRTQIAELEEKAKEQLRKVNEANSKASYSESELKRSREQEKALQNDNKGFIKMCRDAEELLGRARKFFGDREWALFEKQVDAEDKAKETADGKASS